MKNMKKEERTLFVGIMVAVVVLLLMAYHLSAQNKISAVTLETNSDDSTSAQAVQSQAAAAQDAAPSAATATPQPTINPDLVGWLQVPGTEINAPLMQGEDNVRYLTLNEQGEYDGWGCYFADCYADVSAPEALVQNTVIYGHAENPENPDGKKFSQLFRYLELSFLQENPCIYLTVGDETLTFEIFAVFYTEIDFYYINPTPSEPDFDAFLETVQAKNEYLFADADVTEQDKLLTLSTCSHAYDVEDAGDQRLVVMAKLVTQPSTAQTITLNPSPERPVTAVH